MATTRHIRRGFGAFAFTILGLLTFSNVDVEAGNTTCAGNLTDWYTNAVGETACETYQRLRQICNPNYEVPNFRPNTPGDYCTDQLADCCCNSISWALSMLCMNCQWDVIGGSSNGIDAGVGAYGLYRNSSGSFCNPGTNKSLPTGIQDAVCNTEIKLDNFLYELFWSDGTWFFVYTMEYAGEQQVQYNNNTFTHCNSTTSSTSQAPVTLTSTITAATTSASPTSPSTSSSQSNTASVIGGVVGGVAGSALILGTGFVCWRRRNRHQPLPTTDGGVPTLSAVTPYTMTSLAPDHSVQPSGFTQKASYRAVGTNSSSDIGPRSEAETSHPSRDASDAVLYDPSMEPPVRHEDLGPVTTLDRSASGRLPPAYNPQWEPAPRPRARPLPQPSAMGAATSPAITQPYLK